MPKAPTIHWNTDDQLYPRFISKTRCGRMLRKVRWTEDMKDIQCDVCKALAKRDGRL